MLSFLLNRQYTEIDNMSRVVFFGNIFHSLTFTESQTILNGFIAVENGKIIAIGSKADYTSWNYEHKKDFVEFQLSENQFLMPGFIDTHIHAPQVPNIGLGLDKPLMEWLNAYTFPTETEFKDKAFAKNVYEKVVKRTLSSGTTTACYFATIHKTSSAILADEAHSQGQRALVGKVAMNQYSPDHYIEQLEDSIRDNEEFIQYVKSLGSDLITPIITPRFAITCSMEMMRKLASLASKYDLPIQSHISENLDEIKFTLEIFPGHKNYAEVYDTAGLLTNKCIMAHCVHLEDREIELFAKRKTSVAHCPNSNTNLRSGLCDVKRLINGGLKVGLGTDISGGNRISILDSIRAALDVSHHLNFMKKQNVLGTGQVSSSEENLNYEPINYKQAIFLATLGGAQALAMDDKTGNFQIGKSFDALIIDAYAGAIDEFELPKSLTDHLTSLDKFEKLLQKFIYTGDDRNIINVFVDGRQVK
ncbi:guanine deaminase [Chironomus tepperi]|uniref:guanine deaminase n=1 Tax=Chironomus tepperi TaxID=113505 RepID=UPI00391F8628